MMRNRLIVKAVGGCLILSLLSASLVEVVSRRFFPQEQLVATVDLTGLLQEFVKKNSLEAAEVPSATRLQVEMEIEKRASDFARRLSLAASQLGAEYRILILPSEAVLSGAIDLTPELKRMMETADGKQ